MKEERPELPAGWQLAPIDDLGELRLGKMLDKSKNQGIPVQYLRNLNVRWFRFEVEDVLSLLASPDEIEKLSIVDGDLLICEGGEPGRCAVWRGGANAFVYQKALHRFRSHGGIEPEILMYMLRHRSETGALSDSFTGTTIKHLTRESLARLIVAVPPLNEQRRIAAKLDITLAAVDACRQRLDGVEALLKRFRQVVLAAATSGELTREWREENGVSIDSWQEQAIAEISSQVFDGPFGSNLKSDDYTSDGYRVVRLENLSHLMFLEEKRTYVSNAKFESLQRHVLLEGDILFSSFIDEEVRTCILPSKLSGVSINKADCFCIRVDASQCLPEFLVGALSCRSAFAALGGLVHGATRPRINLKQLKSLSLQVPSIPEQQEIVRRTQALFSLADQLEARLTSARRIVERLTPALLAKAFRGELVPQDPGDEPASELLERIQAARQAESAAAGPSRRGRKKAVASPVPSLLEAAPVPPDLLSTLLRECGSLSERALLAASELDPARFRAQLAEERRRGSLRDTLDEDGQVLLEVVG